MIDTLLLQRLIDGELSHRERAAFLQQIEESPQQWKEIALALIEDRDFQQTIMSLKGDADESLRLPRLQSSIDTIVDIPKAQPVALASASQASIRFSMPPLAIAASLLFMCLGYFGGSYLRGLSQSANPSGPAMAGMTSGPIEAGKLRWVSEGAPSQELPLYQVSELDPASLMGAPVAEVERLQRELLRRGVQLQVETEFFEGQLPDGRQVVVPVRNVNLRSVAQ